VTNEERSVDALIAAFRPLIEAAAKAARERRALPRIRVRKAAALGAPDELELDGCRCFRCAPCAWCLLGESVTQSGIETAAECCEAPDLGED
jgi:hypothetical protein